MAYSHNYIPAAKLKIVGNAMILGQIELLAECMTLADKSGVGAANVRQDASLLLLGVIMTCKCFSSSM